MIVYADTSVFVSLYLTDAHTADVQQRVLDNGSLWLTSLHRAEWSHAIAQHVFQKKLSVREAQQISKLFEHDRAAGLWVEADFPLRAFQTCVDLAKQHGTSLGMRTLDSLHVASALNLKAEVFWTFDRRQIALAKAAGLVIE